MAAHRHPKPQSLVLRRRPWRAVLAVLAWLALTWLPTAGALGHAAGSDSGSNAPWQQLCSVNAPAAKTQTSPDDGLLASASAHCAWCLLVHGAAPPPLAWRAPLGAPSGEQPVLAVQAEPPPPRLWGHPPAQAPPCV